MNIDYGHVRTSALDVAFERRGPNDGWPVVLLHGFPYDVRAYDDVADALAQAGADVTIPYLRGYGPTRYLTETTMRSGQQAALAVDLRELSQTLALDRPIVAGYDWGGRAACIATALWPDEFTGLVTAGGYNVHHIPSFASPAPPLDESRLWYQYYFHSERGSAGLSKYRRELARQLWSEWSPAWGFTDADFDATAPSFDNPDFVDTVIHSYRHRYGLVQGDPAYQKEEELLLDKPVIAVPTIIMDLSSDTISSPQPLSHHERQFSDIVEHRVIASGHNVPQERPVAFADAVATIHGLDRSAKA